MWERWGFGFVVVVVVVVVVFNLIFGLELEELEEGMVDWWIWVRGCIGC